MLPFFVYGTLLPEQPNHTLIVHAIESLTAAILHGAVLYDIGGVPMLSDSAENSVRGALITIDKTKYESVIRQLDALEQFNPAQPGRSLYLRETRSVIRPDGSAIAAWVYIGRPAYLAGLAPIGGDWLQYSAESRRSIEIWTNNINNPSWDNS